MYGLPVMLSLFVKMLDFSINEMYNNVLESNSALMMVKKKTKKKSHFYWLLFNRSK